MKEKREKMQNATFPLILAVCTREELETLVSSKQLRPLVYCVTIAGALLFVFTLLW